VDCLEWSGGRSDEVAHPACQLTHSQYQYDSAYLTASTGGLGGNFILGILCVCGMDGSTFDYHDQLILGESVHHHHHRRKPTDARGDGQEVMTRVRRT